MFNNFLPKIAPFMRYIEKCIWDRGATNDVTIWRIRVACRISKAMCTYAHANAQAPGYPHARHAQACTHRPVCNTYCFSTAKMVSWTRLNVTLYVRVSCSLFVLYPYLFLCIDCPSFCLCVYCVTHTHTQTHTHTTQTPMPQAGFELSIPVNERQQTYASDSTATWIGFTW
jgi:hypothetical protein